MSPMNVIFLPFGLVLILPLYTFYLKSMLLYLSDFHEDCT